MQCSLKDVLKYLAQYALNQFPHDLQAHISTGFVVKYAAKY